MNKLKQILLLLLVFILAVVISFYFENSYRVFIRQLFNFFQREKIQFVGKNFHLFASPYLLIAFGLFCVMLTILLSGHSKKNRLIYFVFTALLFVITTFATSFLDSTGYVVECTACKYGVRNLNYNEINYDFHFITSLLVGLLPVIYVFLKTHISKKQPRKPYFSAISSASDVG